MAQSAAHNADSTRWATYHHEAKQGNAEAQYVLGTTDRKNNASIDIVVGVSVWSLSGSMSTRTAVRSRAATA